MSTDHFVLQCFETVGWAFVACKDLPRSDLLYAR